jgi:hypothetical protein
MEKIKSFEEFVNESELNELRTSEIEQYHIDPEDDNKNCTLQALINTATNLVDGELNPVDVWASVPDKNTVSVSYEFYTPDKDLKSSFYEGHGYILNIKFPKEKLEALLQDVEKKNIKSEKATETLESWIKEATQDLQKSKDSLTGYNKENGTEVTIKDLASIQREYMKDVEELKGGKSEAKGLREE